MGNEGMICMLRKQAKLGEAFSIELIRLYFEEHDFELLKEYLLMKYP